MRRFLLSFLLLSAGCKQDQDLTALVGQDGALRFNLTFTNETEVDLDLHVVTPAGAEIYYGATTESSGGALDVDCHCSSCDEGPTENIFWAYDGGAPAGDYQVSVAYYIDCAAYGYDTGALAASDYTLLVLNGGDVVETHEGTLETINEADAYTYSYAP
jgi:uncharacterized protein YfaP (DUF2135 family)